MSRRDQLSRKIRFEVFKRDQFICQYCGNHPPDVILECDHIIPVIDGGNNDEENLITACFDCNRGKGIIPLAIKPKSLNEKAAQVEEQEAQLAGYRRIMQARADRIEDDKWTVANILFPNNDGVRRDWLRSIQRFNELLPLHEVTDAAEAALARRLYSDGSRFRYFCGICWNKIRGGEE